jgi:hypothetical protein
LRYNKVLIEPTIAFKRKDIKDEIADKILNLIRSLKISPLPEECPFGCDGTSYKLKFGGLFHGVQIEWWCDGPRTGVILLIKLMLYLT